MTQSLGNGPTKETGQQLQTGSTLMDRYLIQSILGVGGMGAVYRARDLHFPNAVKLVAVKEMVNRVLDPVVRTTIIRNFEREANILASLDHRAVPRIYDFFTINERSYLVEEYISGQDLETIINNTTNFLPEERVIQWAIEMSDVLHYLHTHKPEPIIFRDMKPSNVMINIHDHAVLIDFGIAKTFQTGQRGTQIGTEGYSPPEQYRGDATPQADIYSLGATLHHLLTKQDPRLEPPFSFSERPIRKVNPNVSLEFETIINSTLQYDPENRIQTALQMKTQMADLARKMSVPSSVHLPAEVKKSSTETNKPVWEFRCEDEIRGSCAEHNGVIYIGCYDNNLYALNSRDGEFIWKFAAEGGIVSKPAIHEGNVFFGSEDHRLYSVNTRNGKINWSYYTQDAIRSSPHLAEGHIFIGSDDTYLHVVNMMTGRSVLRAEGNAPIRSTPLVHSECIYFGTEAGEVYCLEYNGKVRWRFKARRAVTSSPVISHGIIYFGSMDSMLYALDATGGWIIWRFHLGKRSISTPCIEENKLFTGAADGNIYCLDAGSAKEIWHFSTEHQVTGSPIIYKDSLYCGSVDGHLYCLEYHTGRLRWKFKTQGAITGTPTAQDNVIYIGSTDHRVYAFLA
jgi:serine/threonine protein kinase